MKRFLYFFILAGLALTAAIAWTAPADQAPAVEIGVDADAPIFELAPAVAMSYDNSIPEGPHSVMEAQMPSGDLEFTPAPEGGTVVTWALWLWENVETIAGMLLLLIMFYEPIARLTPTERDNNLLRIIQSWLDNLFPNRKRGGGEFTAYKSEKDAPPLAKVKKL